MKNKLILIKEELKKLLDDYNFQIKHNTELTTEDIKEMLNEIQNIKQLLLQESASLEAKLRRLSILTEI